MENQEVRNESKQNIPDENAIENNIKKYADDINRNKTNLIPDEEHEEYDEEEILSDELNADKKNIFLTLSIPITVISVIAAVLKTSVFWFFIVFSALYVLMMVVEMIVLFINKEI